MTSRNLLFAIRTRRSPDREGVAQAHALRRSGARNEGFERGLAKSLRPAAVKEDGLKAIRLDPAVNRPGGGVEIIGRAFARVQWIAHGSGPCGLGERGPPANVVAGGGKARQVLGRDFRSRAILGGINQFAQRDGLARKRGDWSAAAFDQAKRRCRLAAGDLPYGVNAADDGLTIPMGAPVSRYSRDGAPTDEFTMAVDDAAELLAMQSLGVGESALRFVGAQPRQDDLPGALIGGLVFHVGDPTHCFVGALLGVAIRRLEIGEPCAEGAEARPIGRRLANSWSARACGRFRWSRQGPKASAQAMAAQPS